MENKLQIFEVGKLYTCSDRCLLIYPTVESAREADSVSSYAPSIYSADSEPDFAEVTAKYWSRKLTLQVRCLNPKGIFLVLEVQPVNNKIFINCLFPDFIGWIIYYGRFEYEAVQTGI